MKRKRPIYKKIKTLVKSSLYFALLFLFTPFIAYSQKTFKTVVTNNSDATYKTVIAGKKYKAQPLHRFFFGNHYRREWTTPVKVPVLHLDTIAGGLTPVKLGGGMQTQTLHLKNPAGKDYVLRLVDKDYSSALTPIIKRTFVADLAKDAVSASHPFGALTVPPLADAAGIYHTKPLIAFVPYTKSLDTFNKIFSNMLCLLEERADENQQDAPHFGRSKNVVGTEKMFENIFEDNRHRADQKAYAKARLFDMFLGDWSRHEDQWRWATFEEGDEVIYRPIPRDRDQIYFLFDGLLPSYIAPEELEHLETFQYKIKSIKNLNFSARYLDRQLTTEVSQQTWIELANEIVKAMTDDVIEKAIRRLPPEQFAVSGQKIIAKLKSRRASLVNAAIKHYKVLSEEVEVVGSKQAEIFEVKRLNDNETQVNVFRLDSNGTPRPQPYYSRSFNESETDEIRMYGLKGNDRYEVTGNAGKGIPVRIIGGTDKDSLVNRSTVAGSKLKYYDNRDNSVTGSARLHLSNDTAINAYNYRAYKHNIGHTIKLPYFTNTRGIHINMGYTYTRQTWRKEPFGWKQSAKVIYSFTNKSWGAEYGALFNQLIGKWGLALNASYDQVLRNLYFGTGNETKYAEAVPFYRLHTEEGFGSLGLQRALGKHHFLQFSGFYQSVKVINDGKGSVSETLLANSVSPFERKHFAGAEVNYTFRRLNDELVPTKGLRFLAEAGHTKNLQEDSSFNRYVGTLHLFIPLSKTFSIAIKTGGGTITGEPEFYQLNWIGGGQNLKGYRRQRFRGKTSFYDNNELRWITNTRNYIFNGKIGLLAFFDNGRVWQPGELSSKWHNSYGAGFLIAPFHKISASVYFALSEEDQRIHLRLNTRL